ncbi:MAG: tryptophan-rich sensory protein [Candidatus Aenigmarchaeota archaeon]|nr:tryptophan-rich sensory protein [Candidatus Aenigmarchaeota archaeon]
MKVNFVRLVVSVVICELAGIIGSFFTMPSIPTWYASINKPEFIPPNWVFAPVWTTLFLLMGISLYMIWDKGLNKKENKTALYVFGVQLVLNIIWSALFFGLQNPLAAFIEIIVLWVAILASIIFFYRISKWSGIIMIPYILWVSFAAFLTYSVWVLNV